MSWSCATGRVSCIPCVDSDGFHVVVVALGGVGGFGFLVSAGVGGFGATVGGDGIRKRTTFGDGGGDGAGGGGGGGGGVDSGDGGLVSCQSTSICSISTRGMGLSSIVKLQNL